MRSMHTILYRNLGIVITESGENDSIHSRPSTAGTRHAVSDNGFRSMSITVNGATVTIGVNFLL